MKKRILTSGLVTLALGMVLIFVDLHLLRGWFLVPHLFETGQVFDGDITYQISENADGTWDLFIENRDFAYYPIILYRDEVIFDLKDAMLFQYASRLKCFNHDSTIYDSAYGFSCGTGLGWALIRPYETFELKNITLNQQFPDMKYEFLQMREEGILREHMDVLLCQFYLPVFSFGDEASRVYSNQIMWKVDTIPAGY